jgi:tetratricopeptide (TPR) repeat protein
MNGSIPSLIQLLKQNLQPSELPWVAAALRQDSNVWQTLQRPEIVGKMVKAASSTARGWSPAVAAFCALEHPGIQPLPLVEQLQDDLQITVDIPLRQKALSTYEDGPAGDRSEAPGLEKALLLALALRERRRLVGGWKGLFSDLCQKIPAASSRFGAYWETPLACLVGMVPNPHDVLLALLEEPAHAEIRCSLVIHSVLSNPLPPGEQLDLLAALTRHLDLEYQTRLLHQLVQVRPELAAGLARQIVQDQSGMQAEAAQGSPTSSAIQYTWARAQLFALAGESSQAFQAYERAVEESKNLQAHILNSAAQAAWQSGDLEAAALSFEKATALTTQPGNKHLFHSRLASVLVEKGALDSAEPLLTQLKEAGPVEPASEVWTNIQLASARIASQKGEVEKAGEIAGQILEAYSQAGRQTHPADAARLSRLAHLLLEAGKPYWASRAAQLALSVHPNMPELLSLHAVASGNAGDTSAALSSAQLASALVPQSLEYRRRLANLLERAGEWSQALEERQIVLQEAPQLYESTADRLALAQCSVRAGKPESALQICEQILEGAEDENISAEAHWLTGEGLAAMGEYQKAQEHFTTAAQLMPRLAQPWLSSARIYREAGFPGRAMETLRAAVQACSDNYEIHLALGEAYLEDWEGRGRPSAAQALQALEQARRLSTGETVPAEIANRLSLYLGQALRHLGHNEEARKVLEDVFASNPAFPGLAYTLAQVLLALGEPGSALPALKAELENHPRDPIPYMQYAQALLALSEQPHEAVSALRQALEMAPGLLEALGYLAEALEKAGSLEESLQAYQRAMETDLVQDPDWKSRLSFGLGRAALALGSKDLAVAAFEEAAAVDPNNPRIAYHLSEAFQAAGCIDDAIQSGRQALRLGLEDLETLVWFARQAVRWVEILKNQRSEAGVSSNLPWEVAAQLQIEALNALMRAVEMAPERADLRLQLGQMQVQSEDIAAALETFRTITKLDTAPLEVLFRAAQHLLDLDEARPAIAALERALGAARSLFQAKTIQSPYMPQLIETLVTAYRRTGSYQAALDILEEGLPFNPQSIDLYQSKANLLFELGHHAEAMDALEQALALGPQGRQDYAIRMKAVAVLRAAGKLAEALEHSTALVEIYKSPDQGSDELSSRILAAEIARAMLLPERAYAFLVPDPPLDQEASLAEPLPAARARRSVVLEYLCLRAELALDLSEQEQSARSAEHLAAVQDAAAAASKEEKEKIRLRLKVLDARHQARSGSSAAGLEALMSLIKGEDWASSDKIAGSLEAAAQKGFSFALHNSYIAVGLGAIEYGQWGTALNIFRQLAELAPKELYAHFQQARALTLQAEAQRLCMELDAVGHAPGEEALGEYAQLSFEQALLLPVEIVHTWNKEPVHPLKSVFQEVLFLLQRWQQRGRAAFEPGEESSQALAAACGSTPHPMETTAIIAALRGEASIEAAQSGGEENSRLAGLASQAARSHPNNPVVLAQLALNLRRQEDLLPDALKAARQALQLFRRRPAFQADSPVAFAQDQGAVYHAVLGSLAFASGDLALAGEAMASALDAWPKEPRWHDRAAEIAARRGELSTAVSHLEQAVLLEPEHTGHYLSLGRAYLSLALAAVPGEENSAERAVNVLEQAYRMAPESPEAGLLLAKALLLSGDLARASHYAEVILSIAPDQTQPLLLCAEIALKKHDYQEAYERFQTALRLHPNQEALMQDPHAALLLVRALQGLGRHEHAISALETALKHAGNPLPLLLEKVRIVEFSQGTEKAADVLQALNERYPDQPRLLLPMAESLERIGDPELAILCAQKALHASHQSPDQALSAAEQARLHFLLGRLLRQTGHLDQAVHHLNESIQLAPESVDAYLELGLTQQDRRQHSQAIKVYEQAARIAPRDSRPYYHAGLVLREGKDYAAAESMLRRAAELEPDDVMIQRQLAAITALNLVHTRLRRTTEL